MMFGLGNLGNQPASWFVFSKKDPRWTRAGSCRAGMFGSQPPEVTAAIEALKRLYGKPPDDLRFSVEKD